jgi:hypothetical protein
MDVFNKLINLFELKDFENDEFSLEIGALSNLLIGNEKSSDDYTFFNV